MTANDLFFAPQGRSYTAIVRALMTRLPGTRQVA